MTGEGLTSPVCSSGRKTLFSGGHPTAVPFNPRSAQSGTRCTLQLMVSGSSAPVTDSGPTCQRQHLRGEGKDQNVTTISSHFFCLLSPWSQAFSELALMGLICPGEVAADTNFSLQM